MATYDIKKKAMLAKYQYDLFRKELEKKQQQYAGWKDGQAERAKKAGLVYTNYEDLYNDYIIGAIDEETFWRQKSKYNLIIADNMFREEKIQWLQQNCDKYKRRYEALEGYYKESKRRDHNESQRRYVTRKNGIKRRTYDFTKRRSKYNLPKQEKEALKREREES